MSAARIKWIADCLHESIANLGYPVGMGIAPPRETLERAAAEIVRVDEKADAAINAELLEALKPFSLALGQIADTDRDRWPDNETIEHSGAAEEIEWGDLRRARAAILKSTGGAS